MNKTLESYPKETIIITYKEYMETPLFVLSKMQRDGYEITEINKQQQYVIIIR